MCSGILLSFDRTKGIPCSYFKPHREHYLPLEYNTMCNVMFSVKLTISFQWQQRLIKD